MTSGSKGAVARVRKILAPVDPSPCSMAALEYATSMAEQLGGSVDALHVHEHRDFKVGSTVPLAPDVLTALEREMEATVRRTAERLGDRFRELSDSGDPLKRILEAAERGGYD